jgi:lysophospholipase L1-like esterase
VQAMKRRAGLSVALSVVMIALVVAILQAWPSPSRGEGAQSISGDFYLDVGASTSLGFQPTGIPAHNGSRTNTGYANDVVAMAAANHMSLALRQVGCPGEQAQTMLLMGDACYKPPGRQLSTALQFLRAHVHEVGLVTIDLGFNNIRLCLWPATVNVNCAQHGIAQVTDSMPAVVRDLQRAAGPSVHFVGVLYADPFLTHDFDGPSGVVQANISLSIVNQLNQVLIAAYRAAHIPVANVAGAFQSNNLTPTTIAKRGTVPTNLARICALTWMCHGHPWGPDDHPTNAGYQVIAKAIMAELPRSW